jgi:hypothetical protein
VESTLFPPNKYEIHVVKPLKRKIVTKCASNVVFQKKRRLEYELSKEIKPQIYNLIAVW